LHKIDAKRFQTIAEELQRLWQARTMLLLNALGPKVILAWIRMEDQASPLGPEPGLITRKMLDALAPHVLEIVEIPVRPAGGAGDLAGMSFGALEEPAVEHAVGPEAHMRIAWDLDTALSRHF